MSRTIVVGAAQLGPIARAEDRASVVARMIALLDKAAQLDPNDNLGASVIARLKDESAPARKGRPWTPPAARRPSSRRDRKSVV